MEVEKGSLLPRPDDPIVFGGEFVGWFTDIEFANPYDFSRPVLADFTLYGAWIDKVEAETMVDGFTFDYYEDLGGYVVNDYWGEESVVEVPGSLTTYSGVEIPVVKIGDNAFYGREGIKEVALPDSITTIGKNAFSFTSLEILNVTKNITYIDDEAFLDCPYGFNHNYGAYFIPSKESAYCVLYKYDDTSTVSTFPADCNVILDSLGDLKRWQGEVDASKVVYMVDNAFKDQNITSVALSEELRTLGKAAFKGCSALAVVTGGPEFFPLPEETFADCSALTSISIKPMEVGERCFANDASLAQFEFSPNIETIGSQAFSGVVALESLTIPSKVSEIGAWAFEKMSGLKNLVFNAEEASNFAAYELRPFLNSENIENVTFGEGAKSIPSYLLANTKVTQISLPSSLTHIGDRAFYESSLTQIELNDGLTDIGNEAFAECASLSSLTLPNSVLNLGDDMCRNCSSLTTLNLPSNIETIGSRTFANITGLTSLTLPESLTSLGDGAFKGCTDLASVIWNATNVSKSGSSESPIFAGCEALANVTFGENVTNIPAYALYGIKGMANIAIPNGVTSIGDEAFGNCTSLTSLALPDSVVDLGEYLCRNCSALTALTLPSTLETIGAKTFAMTTGLTSITLPEPLKKIGDLAFSDCYKLASVIWNATAVSEAGTSGAEIFQDCIALSNITFGENVITIPDYALYGVKGISELTIPSKVNSIGNQAFAGCVSLASVNWNAVSVSKSGSAESPIFDGCNELVNVTFGSGVTNVPAYALYGVKGVTKIVVPTGVTTIGQEALSGCEGLKEISLPETLTKIGTKAFKDCVALSSITLPDSLQEMEESILEGCKSLAKLTTPFIGKNSEVSLENDGLIGHLFSYEYFLGSTKVEQSFDGKTSVICYYPTLLTEITVTKTLSDGALSMLKTLETLTIGAENIGVRAVDSVKSLTSLTLLDSVKNIGEYAFYDCEGITQASFGKGLEQIGPYAFGFCKGLTELVLPSSLTKVESYAFQYCNSVTYLEAGEDTVFAFDVFEGCIGVVEAKVPASAIGYNFAKNAVALEKLTITNGSLENNLAASTKLKTLIIGGKVDSLVGGAFRDLSSLTDLTIEDGDVALKINYSAFEGCSGLTSLNLPARVCYLGQAAFGGMNELTTLTVNGEFIKMAKHPFGNNAKLKVVNWNVKDVDGDNNTISTFLLDSPFDGCTALTEVRFGEGVTFLPEKMFMGLGCLTSFSVSEGITDIGYQAFYQCANLKEIALPSTLQNIYEEAFFECTGLTDCVLPSSLTLISKQAFSGCSGLTELVIPSSLKTIGESAFENCLGLTSLDIPSTLEDLGSWSFQGCTNLKDVKVAAKKVERFTEVELDSLVLGEGIEEIGKSAFYGYPFATLELPSTLISIGENAFNAANNLTSITFKGNKLTSIGDNAFQNDSKLTSLALPSSLTSIGYGAFGGCNALVEMDLPFVGTSIEADPTSQDAHFGRIFGLWGNEEGSIVIMQNYQGGSTSYRIPASLRTVTVRGGNIGAHAFMEFSQLTSIILPDGLTSIGGEAFLNCSGLTSLDIPQSVTSIGNDFIKGATGITSLELPSGLTDYNFLLFVNLPDLVTLKAPSLPSAAVSYMPTTIENLTIYNGEIDESILSGYNSLKNLTLGDGVTVIGDKSFQNCTGLVSVTFGKNIVSIGNYAFAGCTSLSGVDFSVMEKLETIGSMAFSGDNGGPIIEEVVINSPAFTTIYPDAFLNCTTLTKVDLSKTGLATIGSYDGYSWTKGTFAGCTALTEVKLPATLTDLGNRTFVSCTNLAELDLSHTKLAKIGDSLFGDCTSLTSLLLPDTFTEIGSSPFAGTLFEAFTVPSSVTSISYDAFSTSNITNLVCYADGFTVLRGDSVDKTYGCLTNSKVTDLTIGEGVKTISASAFRKATTLVNLTLPDSLVSIDKYAFSGSGITSVTLGVNIRKVDSTAFDESVEVTYAPGNPYFTPGEDGTYSEDGKTLIKVTPKEGQKIFIVPGTVTTIQSGAFDGCGELEEIIITDNVTSLPAGLLADCVSLKSLTIPFVGQDDDYHDKGAANTLFGHLFSTVAGDGLTKVTQSYREKVIGESNTVDYYIPTSLKEVYAGGGYLSFGAFSGCYTLEKIDISSGMKNTTLMPAYAFRECTGLKEVIYPDSVASIGAYAFYGCSSLKQAPIGPSVTTIREYAFSSCGLTEVVIPSTVTTLGSNVFSSNKSLTSVTFPLSISIGSTFSGAPSNVVWKIAEGITEIPDNKFQSNTMIRYLVIPEGVTSIGKSAFYRCSNLMEVTLPSTLTSIGESAFRNTALTEINLPEGLTYLGISAFESSALTKVVLPSTLTSVASMAFAYNPNLVEVTIPTSIESIYSQAFFRRNGVDYSIFIPDSVTYIGQEAFDNHTTVNCQVESKPDGYHKNFASGTVNWGCDPE